MTDDTPIETSEDEARPYRRDLSMDGMATPRGAFNAETCVQVAAVHHIAASQAAKPAKASNYAQRHAIKETHRIEASALYFRARTHLMDTVTNRNIFEAGFDRGYAAAPQEQTPADKPMMPETMPEHVEQAIMSEFYKGNLVRMSGPTRIYRAIYAALQSQPQQVAE